MDPGNHVLDGVQMLPQRGALLGECMARCKAEALGLGKRVSCAITVGPILSIYIVSRVCVYKEVPCGGRNKAAPIYGV